MLPMGSSLPGIVTHRKPKRMALDEGQSYEFGQPIRIKSGTTDSGHTGQTNVLRPGGIFVEETGSTGYFVPAADADWADIAKGSLGAITSEEAPDDDWESKTLYLYRNGILVASVALGANDDTTAEVVTALNGDTSFRKHALASGDNGNPLVITDDNPGAGGALTVVFPLTTAYATAIDTTGNGSNDSSIAHAKSTLPDVRVIGEEVAMVDSAGNAQAGYSSFNLRAGHFRASKLIVGGTQATTLAAIPAWVRAIFEARGSTFVL